MAYKKISDYGLIGDMHSVALVGIDGSIDWCCLPRFDSPSVFAAILDDEKGGRFQIAPVDSYRSTQCYLPNTNVLQTTFKTGAGDVSVIDYMPLDDASRYSTCPHEIHRIVRCTKGRVELICVFQPRFDYARAETTMEGRAGGLIASGGGETLTISSSVPLEVRAGEALAQFALRRGQEASFVVAYGRSNPRPVDDYHPLLALQHTRSVWEDRVRTLNYQGLWREEVVRSFLALHLMIFAPSGAIVAAPTTSLPEVIGGERNWDYRYAWLRDSAFTVGTLYRLGYFDEANGFIQWLLRVAEDSLKTSDTKALYGISSHSTLKEEELGHLEGYRGSNPVRIGNAASSQLQLDVFGEVILSFNTYRRYGGKISDDMWRVVSSFADVVCGIWKRRDRSIWEVRGEPRHFVFSKVMCWVALDRAIQIAEATGRQGNVDGWREVAALIKEDVLARGWSESKKSFAQSYDTDILDASSLILSWVNLLPVDDPRIQSTLRNTIAELSHGPFMYRYKVHEADDGLTGEEGAFVMLSFWAVGGLLNCGEVDKARETFEEILGYANHVGLFAEMIDPVSREALGNFPQAFSHVGVIHTARNLTAALSGQPMTRS